MGLAAMLAWFAALIFGLPVGGSYGALHWHAHEMLFGYTSASLAGFMLTAIPNWTGRLPVSGTPLALLGLLWISGRVAMAMPDLFGLYAAAAIDAIFLPALGLIAAREIGTGRNWKNLHVVVGLALLTTANIWFHLSVLSAGDTGYPHRMAISVWLLLVTLVGGRLAVSFTNNWLSRRGVSALPASFGLFDRFAFLFSLAALASWIALPGSGLTLATCGAAGLVQLWRLSRWRGWTTFAEPLVAVLHVAYFFVPLGFLTIAASAGGFIGQTAALHVLTVGVIGTMTLSVMTRVTRGHTGNPLHAGGLTTSIYVCIALSALVRPLADFLPDRYVGVLGLSALLWIMAYTLFLAEYAPMLLRPRRQAGGPL